MRCSVWTPMMICGVSGGRFIEAYPAQFDPERPIALLRSCPSVEGGLAALRAREAAALGLCESASLIVWLGCLLASANAACMDLRIRTPQALKPLQVLDAIWLGA